MKIKGNLISLISVLFILSTIMAMTGCATTPLRDAVGKGDINTVKDILDKGGDINEKYYGIPLLHVTVVDPIWGLNTIGCRTEMAKVLLERGADVNAKDTSWNVGPLALAAYGGCNRIVSFLVERGANVDEAISQLESWFLKGSESKSGIKILENTKVKQDRVKQPTVASMLSPTLTSDVDELPAIKAKPNKNSYAIVIGIENYRQKLPKADYAVADAKTVTEYLTKVMGYPEENVVTLMNDRASLTDFIKYFEKWLPNNVEKDSMVFVYYSGHGAPNTKTGDAYLVPYDGDPSFIEQTGYPLKKLYELLNKLQAKEIIVALDSCFSGAGGKSVIAKGARPLVMNLEQDMKAFDKLTILSAASGDQTSSTYDEKGHGLFTYFMLKGIKNEDVTRQDGSIKMDDLFSYIKPQVERIARKQYNNEQTPQLFGGKHR
ncbi:MAG: ankyrin [Nitrospirae bacterium]|nr:MAG: ankyrin [Nitrospirota bacterium]